MTIGEKISAALSRLPFDIKDALTFGGLAILTIGAGQMYQPLALVVPGVFFMWLGLWSRG